MSIILQTDSYKVTHHVQYPPETTSVYSYYESRGGRWPYTTFFGLQYVLARHLEGVRVTPEAIEEAEELLGQHLLGDIGTMFNRAGWQHIVDEHGGRLPVRIKAVPEGAVIPNRNVLMTVENTDPATPWLTNYLETLLCQVWYPITVATQGTAIRRNIDLWLSQTGGDMEGAPFKLHDFGFRGVSSVESAGIGGLAHLVNFQGTDTMEALLVGRQYYDVDCAGFSIPAAEHSTITSWGRESEAEAFRNMVAQFGGGPLFAVVSDSYDIYHAARDIWGGELRDEVMAADGLLVLRPDSGDPREVVMRLLAILGDRFGTTATHKGFKVLNHVRVIQGDGVDESQINGILTQMYHDGWSIDNIAFGMGGALLQKLDRDTQRFAFKCSAITVDGKERDVWKDPVTAPGKTSKKGRLKLSQSHGIFGATTVPEDSPVSDYMEVVFEDGEIKRRHSLEDVRRRAEAARPLIDQARAA